MIRVSSKGDLARTKGFLDRLLNREAYRDFDKYGRMGVAALASATPRDSGVTAGSWTYGVERGRAGMTLYWNNTNVNDGSKIAILIQYGHGTGTGGYVTGTDYINPAIRPIFDQIAAEVWKKVTSG